MICKYSGCYSLTSVNIPSSVTTIEAGAFFQCYNLESVQIDDLEAWCNISFGPYEANPLYNAHHLFLNGEEIEDLVIPNSLSSIGNEIFEGCSSITSVTIPNGVTSIGDRSFYGCSNLTSIIIPNSVTSIGYSSFAECISLSSVSIPNSVTVIGSNSFNGTDWYEKQSDGILYLNNHLIGYKGNKPSGALRIAEGTKCIANHAFFECYGLTSVSIPNSVTSIGSYTFYGCI